MLCSTALTLPAIALASVLLPGVALAQSVTGSGDYTADNPLTTPVWNAGNVTFGDAGTGSLGVSGTGAEVTADFAYFGASSTGDGSLLVTDGATVELLQGEIGQAGQGQLDITDGGSLTAGDAALGGGLLVGSAATGEGIVNVDGIGSDGTASSLQVDWLLSVGVYGGGTVNVTDGGQLGTLVAIIGEYGGATGIVNVNGVNANGTASHWESDNGIEVARAGEGTLNVEDGGSVLAQGIIVGTLAPGVGTINVDGGHPGGDASSVTAVQGAYIGYYGNGELNLTNGGVFDAPTVDVAYYAGSTGVVNIGTGGRAGVLEAETLNGGEGEATVNFDHTDDITFATAMTGLLTVNQMNVGETRLTGANTYSGDTTVSRGVLSAGAANVFSSSSDYFVDEAGALNLRGFDQTIASLDNAGLVATNGAGPGTRLTVTGDYVGSVGTIALNTRLGSDNSPTDKLIVEGDTSGTSRLVISNLGGAGAQTTGDGIEVVQVDGASDGQFSSSTLYAGAYEYNLFQGGIATPDDGDWYLRSSLSSGAQTVTPYADALIRFGQLSVGTLQQRTGNRLWPNEAPAPGLVTKAPVKAPAYAPTAEAVGGGMWGRLVGQHSSQDPTRGSAYDADIYFGQVGAEGVVHESSDGVLVAGLIGTYGSQSVDVALSRDPVTEARRSGKIDTDAYGAGFNLTWLGTDGFYVDGVGQYTWYDSDLTASGIGSLARGNHGDGYALSLEVGKRLALSGGWAWVPQAQLIYSSVDFDDFVIVNPDDTLTGVSASDGDSLLGRLGVRLETLSTNGSQRFQGYGLANLTYEFLDGTSVDVGATTLRQEGQDFWGEVGLGGTYAFNGKMSLYGEARYGVSLEDFGDSYSYAGNIGLRVNW